jgi:hypothetical protein
MSGQKYASMVQMHLTLREQGWVPSETGTSALFNGGYAPFYCWTHPSRPRLNVETIEGVWFVNHGFADGGSGAIVAYGQGNRSLCEALGSLEPVTQE